MDLILYDPKDPVFPPPHEPVFDALRASDSGPLEARVEQHQERIAAGVDDPYCFICAACNWNDPAVKKARAKKKKALDKFIKTGKLPPLKLPRLGVSRIPKALTDEEAGRIVLPDPPTQYKTCTAGIYRHPDDKWIKDPCSRYLEAMGETRRDGGGWTCGCKVTRVYEGGQACDPCERHRGAFEGTEDNV